MRTNIKQLNDIHEYTIQMFNAAYLPYKKTMTRQQMYNILLQYIERKYVNNKINEVVPMVKQRFKYVKYNDIIFELYNVYNIKMYNYNTFRTTFEENIGNTYILKVYIPCGCGYNYLYHHKEKHYKTANHKKFINKLI
jgi:hypothetical protein